MKFKNVILKFLSLIFILNSVACIHTESYEVKTIDSDSEKIKYTDSVSNKKLEIKSVIYSDDKFPLEEFFYELSMGRFKKSFKRARLSYKPSTTQNEILKNLLSSGLVPVYVSIKNVSLQEQKVQYSQFVLVEDENHKYSAFNPIMLPDQIKQFSPAAVTANVYNVTLVTTTALLIAILLAHSPGNLNIPNSGGGLDSDFEIINKTEKTTRIDYRDYVIKSKTLKAQEEIRGLLFFNLESMQDTSDLKLDFLESIN